MDILNKLRNGDIELVNLTRQKYTSVPEILEGYVRGRWVRGGVSRRVELGDVLGKGVRGMLEKEEVR